MAIIGFIFCCLVLLYFTFALGFMVLGTIALTGELGTGEKIATIIGLVVLCYSWYGLFSGVAISIEGI